MLSKEKITLHTIDVKVHSHSFSDRSNLSSHRSLRIELEEYGKGSTKIFHVSRRDQIPNVKKKSVDIHYPKTLDEAVN